MKKLVLAGALCMMLFLLCACGEGAASSYGVNERGLTYGSLADVGSSGSSWVEATAADREESDFYKSAPDLIKAEASNGEVGYVYKSDLLLDSNAKEPMTVYALDGVSAIGEFVSQ